MQPSSRRLSIALGALIASTSLVTPLSAQRRFDRGNPPGNVELTVREDNYTLSGTTAPDIRAQLDAIQRGIARSQLVYSYRYDAERIVMVDGTPSQSCRVDRPRIILEFNIDYPEWEPSGEASDELREAWDVFEESLTLWWEYRRDRSIAQAREALDDFRRLEMVCQQLGARMQILVRQAFGEDPPDWLVDAGPPPPLLWPPRGYERLMTVGTDQGASSSATATASSPPSPTPGDATPTAPVTPPAAAAGPPSIPSTTPRTQPSPDIQQAAQRDLTSGGPTGSSRGFSMALVYGGELQLLSGFAIPTPDDPGPMPAETPFVFPGFAEVLIGTFAGALNELGVLDLDAPLAELLPELDERLGSATLEQLLSHRAGLDNAPPTDTTASWSEVLDALDDRALFTDPGTTYSYSRYSYGLAIRALEAATHMPLDQGFSTVLLPALGLTGTTLGPSDGDGVVDGVPVVTTTVPDLVAFATDWSNGDIGGSGPSKAREAAADGPAWSRQSFHRGLWIDEVGGMQRVMLMCNGLGASSGLQIYPERQSIVAYGGEGALPLNTLTFVVSRLGEALELGDDVYGPPTLYGGGSVGREPRRCQPESLARQRRPANFGPPAPAGEWVGRYLNGRWFFALDERDGVLVSPRQGRDPYDVTHFGGDDYFASVDLPPRSGFPIRLFRDSLGRRYVRVGDLTFMHEDDRSGS